MLESLKVSASWLGQALGVCRRPHVKPPRRLMQNSKARGAIGAVESAGCRLSLAGLWSPCCIPMVPLCLAYSPIPPWAICASRSEAPSSGPVLIGHFRAVWRCRTAMLVLFLQGAGPTALPQSVRPCQEVLQALHVQWCCQCAPKEGPLGWLAWGPHRPTFQASPAARHKAFQRNKRGSTVPGADPVHAQSGWNGRSAVDGRPDPYSVCCISMGSV